MIEDNIYSSDSYSSESIVESIDEQTTGWQILPDVLLEEIFSMLTMKHKHIASQVCSNWRRIFYSSKVWSTFILNDEILTKRKYNYYLGYQRILDHYRTQTFLNRMGLHLRTIIVKPMENLFNLYEFLKIMSYFAEFYDTNPLERVHTLDFTFFCHQLVEREGNQELVIGTGGKLLQSLIRLMRNLNGLQHLSLRELLLEPNEAQYLLDDVVINCCQTLVTLKLVNCSRLPYPILHAGVFINLKQLVISPQHLSDDVVELLAQTRLKDIWIVQTKNTEQCNPVSARAWKECRKLSPMLRIHLVVTGKVNTEIVWQESESIKSITYDSPHTRQKCESILLAISLYSYSLECLAFHGLPRYHLHKQFGQRSDTSLVLLCQMCTNIKTLIIRELISTASLLVIVTTGQQLTNFIVRKNAVIKKCDWKQQPEWSDQFYLWLKIKSRSYEDTFEEVSKILNKKWLPLTDEEFKRIKPEISF